MRPIVAPVVGASESMHELPEQVPMITQERAYTSPIWYTP